MNCKECKNLISELADLKEVSSNAELSAHLGGCEECRKALKYEIKLRESFEEIAEESMPAEVARKILSLPGSIKPASDPAAMPAWLKNLHAAINSFAFKVAVGAVILGFLYTNVMIVIPFRYVQQTIHDTFSKTEDSRSHEVRKVENTQIWPPANVPQTPAGQILPGIGASARMQDSSDKSGALINGGRVSGLAKIFKEQDKKAAERMQARNTPLEDIAVENAPIELILPENAMTGQTTAENTVTEQRLIEDAATKHIAVETTSTEQAPAGKDATEQMVTESVMTENAMTEQVVADYAAKGQIPGAVSFALESEAGAVQAIDESGKSRFAMAPEEIAMSSAADEVSVDASADSFSETSADAVLAAAPSNRLREDARTVAPASSLKMRASSFADSPYAPSVESKDKKADSELEIADARAGEILKFLQQHDLAKEEGFIDLANLAMRGYIGNQRLRDWQPPAGSSWYLSRAEGGNRLTLRRKP